MLALYGGNPVRTKPFPSYVTIGDEEKRAVMEVLESAVLSKYLGTWSPDFFGGPCVQQLEREWADYFGIQYAVSVNSATSGLYAAIGAVGIEPGDEVIVTPFTMSASATGILVYGGIPVFADIDPDTFCISPESIEQRISSRTKAIVAVDLFGHPANWAEIMAIARRHGLKVIEDAAQAPGAKYHGAFAGTLADIGVFSLNYHKTIHSGEGGVVVTNDPELAERVQLIRNHAEVVVKDKGVQEIHNLLGFNFRMTEIEAAIAREQLRKLEALLDRRIRAAHYLTERLGGWPGIFPPVERGDVRHGYYVYAIRYQRQEVGISREQFVAALNAEGIPVSAGYQEPLYLLPLYQKRTAIGRHGFPFTLSPPDRRLCYDRGLCPVAERMYEHELMLTNVCHAGVSDADLDDVVQAVAKIMNSRHELARMGWAEAGMAEDHDAR